ncbi:AFR1 (YDR085C) and YER158C [Zygosaccharomyces parabailii]|nr:AFR1 (YDR085C) and YER158C [Zygosaccharomyces parabailii]
MSMMDNASVCSGQSATTSMGMQMNIPRSNSTTDLFSTALPGTGIRVTRKRKPGLDLKQSASASSLDLRNIPRNTRTLSAPPYNSRLPYSVPRNKRPLGPISEVGHAKLTPYQLQRKQMRSSFQFPNGENFTPKNRYMSKSSSTLSLASRSQSVGGITQRPAGPMLGTTSRSVLSPMSHAMQDPMQGPMQGPLLGTMPRSQSLTSLSPFQSQMRGPLPKQLGHLSASPVNSTDSTVSSNSGSSVGSRATTVTTPEKSMQTAFGPVFVPETTLKQPEARLGQELDPIVEPKPDHIITPKLDPILEPNSESIVEERPKSKFRTTSQPDVRPDLELKDLQQIADPLIKLPGTLEMSNEPTLSSHETPPEEKTPEPTKSKIGKLFRKIFHSSSTGSVMRKRKRNQRDSNSTTPSSSSSPVLAPPPKARHRVSVTAEGSPLSSPMGIGLTKDQCEHGSPIRSLKTNLSDNWQVDNDDCKISLTTSLENEDDVLMDTDLVFDSLLLKADSSSTSSWKKQQDLQLKLQALASPEKSQQGKEASLRKQTSEEDDPNVDYELVREFSKLGSYIEAPTITPTSGRFPNLPQRSPRRPSLPNKHLAKSFYDQDYSENKLIKRLQKNWGTIHFDSTPPVATNEGVREKSLRFAEDVYVKDTWSPEDYLRSDKNFIKDRRRMMQLENSGFIQSIKLELNEYKRHEMPVHCDSTKFTHFFV